MVAMTPQILPTTYAYAADPIIIPQIATIRSPFVRAEGKKEQEQEQTMEDEIGNWTKKQHIKQPVLIKQQEQHIGVRSTTYV